jgi:hypothetical protein
MGIERDIGPVNVEDEFHILCKRLSEAQDQESLFAALDDVTAYLTRQYASRQAGIKVPPLFAECEDARGVPWTRSIS